MEQELIKVLAVDDDDINLEIIQHGLEAKGYDIIVARDGQEGWNNLQRHPDTKAIILDRMMPNVDGMEFTKMVKNSERYCHIPIIMQTAASTNEQVIEGINAGVYYYLTKPYKPSLLSTIVSSAIRGHHNPGSLKEEIGDLNKRINNLESGLSLLSSCKFAFQTPEQALSLSFVVATCFPDPKEAVLGIMEVLVNAIEHGNLGISFSEKSELMHRDALDEEIAHRLKMDQYKDLIATAEVTKTSDKIILTVVDQGGGFDWHDFLDFSPKRATAPNGRGIAMANKLSFDEIEYVDPGNKVICSINIANTQQKPQEPEKES